MTFRFMHASHTEITTTTVYVQCTLSTTGNSSLDSSTLKLSTASHGHVTHEYSVTLQQVSDGGHFMSSISTAQKLQCYYFCGVLDYTYR